MPIYRGNVGNLLQHWVLCEILNASHDHAGRLLFVDSHAMSPFATERPRIDDTAPLFDSVSRRLPGAQSSYEEAWHRLAALAPNRTGYPNSASFVVNMWSRDLSLLLCEADPATVGELRAWAHEMGLSGECVFDGDWRLRFNRELPVSADLVFFSFDPYMISHVPVGCPKPANMYPDDLDLLAADVARIPTGIVVQLSTYSTQNGNSQDEVTREVQSRLSGAGLKVAAKVRPLRKDGQPNLQMMSLVLTRGLPWAGALQDLEARFHSWLRCAMEYSGEVALGS